MSTPGAIAVYTSGTGVPENVRTRPWRGVYHHWDGDPDGLGQHLIQRVHSMRGELHAVARLLVDEAPWGWSNCIDSDERYSKDDPGLPVSPADTGNVAYVYVLDVEARRLDAFATHADADGERIGSIHFSQLLDAFWIAFRDPLRRSGARQRETFKALFRAYADQ